MPVSVVCESTANLNAALRESLGNSVGYGADDVKLDVNTDDDDCLQTKLAASAKRILLSKIEYEEVEDYNQSYLQTLRSKYILLNPPVNAGQNENGGNRKDSAGTCVSGIRSNNNDGGVNGFVTEPKESTSNSSKQRPNSNELPQPKRVLYPRDDVRIGWKNSPRKWQVGVGMMNVGNTCYLNSTLQALFHVPSMANWLLSDTQHMERCDSVDAGCIICAMAKTLYASQTSQSAIRPYCVYSKLKLICKHLVMGRQEDAHEFLRYLVEAMEKSYLSRFRNYKELDQYSKETTPLNQILGGYLKTAVRCLACGHVSVTFQHFQDLLLDIRKADTLEEALEGYFSRERLEDMGYKCEACKKKVSATKQFSLERAPIALCIQLKRFSMLGTKINKQITLKPRLDLTKYASRRNTGEQLTYRLVSMVTHLGASQHCGHYTAIGLTESGTYYNYDDSYVRPIPVQNVCNTNAYIIFYEMDSTPTHRHSVTSTQVSGADAKENYQMLNGCATGLASPIYNGSPSPQRMMGPQLPSASITSPLSNSNSNDNNTNVLSTNGNNLNGTKCLNGDSPSKQNNSKITIHYKSKPSPLKISAATTSTASLPTSSTIPCSQMQNGTPSEISRYQESNQHSKSPLFHTSHKELNGANGGKEISSDDDADEVSSTTTTQQRRSVKEDSSSKSTLPSMPKLFEYSHLLSQDKLPSPETSARNSQKSLVPYDSASDEDDEQSSEKIAPSVEHTRDPRKHTSSSTDDEKSDETPGYKMRRSGTVINQIKITKSTTDATENCLQSKDRINSANPIDEIFNSLKRNSYTSNNSNSNGNKSCPGTPTKRTKFSAQELQKSPNDTQPEAIGHNNNHEFHPNAQQPELMWSHSTPPSPSAIKTKTGLWQITPLKPEIPTTSTSSAISPTENLKVPISYKNPNNPFAKNSIKTDLFTRRPKLNLDKHPAASHAARGNGYHADAVSGNVVNELLKQTHRPFSTPVLNWDGTESTIHKEIIEEARQQRRLEWEEEEENDLDRGRQKKTKPYKEMRTTTPGYNPFQEQDNQRQWRQGSGASRFYGGGGGGYFCRNNFNRNRGRGGTFKRFNYKYQRGGSNYSHHNGYYKRAS